MESMLKQQQQQQQQQQNQNQNQHQNQHNQQDKSLFLLKSVKMFNDEYKVEIYDKNNNKLTTFRGIKQIISPIGSQDHDFFLFYKNFENIGNRIAIGNSSGNITILPCLEQIINDMSQVYKSEIVDTIKKEISFLANNSLVFFNYSEFIFCKQIDKLNKIENKFIICDKIKSIHITNNDVTLIKRGMSINERRLLMEEFRYKYIIVEHNECKSFIYTDTISTRNVETTKYFENGNANVNGNKFVKKTNEITGKINDIDESLEFISKELEREQNFLLDELSEYIYDCIERFGGFYLAETSIYNVKNVISIIENKFSNNSFYTTSRDHSGIQIKKKDF